MVLFEIKDYEYDKATSRCVDVIRKVEITEEELATAIMADSIGYAGPEHAMSHVQNYLAGKTHAYCERGDACFGGDLKKLIDSAVMYWHRISPEQRERFKEFAKQWARIEKENEMAGWAISSLYPTMNI